MSKRQLPSRVILLHNDSYCKDMNSARVKAGLSRMHESRWNDSWCFCGAACDNGLLPVPSVSMSHCHLFGVNGLQQIATGTAASGHNHIDDKANGKTRCSLLLDGSTVQLASVTCSYRIPSNVEFLDLAVSCLERMSGSYFISRKLPCVMSVCSCKNAQTELVRGKRSSDCDSRKKHTRKQRKCDLARVKKHCTGERLTDDSSQMSHRCTRSASKQLVCQSSGNASAAAATDAGTDAGTGWAAADVADRRTSEHSLESAGDCHSNCCVTLSQSDMMLSDERLQLMRANSAERKSKAAAAAADRCNSQSTCDADSDSVRGTTDTHRSLTNDRQQRRGPPKGVANKKQPRHISYTTRKLRRGRPKGVANKKQPRHVGYTTRKLRSQTSSSSLSSLEVVTNKQLQSESTAGHTVTGDGLCSAYNPITAVCEIVVPRLAVHGSCSRRARKQRVCARAAPSLSRCDAAVPLIHTDNKEMAGNVSLPVDSMVPVLSSMAKSQKVNNVASEPGTNCEVSKLSALSVDVSYDCDDVCSSPTSPLPCSFKMTGRLLQSTAVLLARRSVCSVVLHSSYLAHNYC